MFLLYVILGLVITVCVGFTLVAFRRSDHILRFWLMFAVYLVSVHGLAFLFNLSVLWLTASYAGWAAYIYLVLYSKLERV